MRYASLILTSITKTDGSLGAVLRAIEIGCGSATTLKFIGKRLGKVRCFALDLSTQALQVAKANSSTLRCTGGNAIALPFRDKTFDLSLNVGLIEHFDRAIARDIVDEHCRVTKAGGRVAIVVPWRDSPYNLIRIVAGSRWPFGDEDPFSVIEIHDFLRQLPLSDVTVKIVYLTTLLAVGTKKPESQIYEE